MKLDAKKRPAGVFHGLNRRALVPRGGVKTFWQLLHFVKMRMPNGNSGRQVLEDPLAVRVDGKVATLAFRTFVALAWFEPGHQIHRSAKGQRHLLMSAADTQYRLFSFLDDFKNASE